MAVRRRTARHGLLAVLLAGSVVSLPTPAEAAPAWAPPTAADVSGIKVKPVAVTPRPDWTAADREVTEADLPADVPVGVQVVDLTTAAGSSSARSTTTGRVRAGQLPIYLSPVASATAAHPSAGARAGARPVGRVRVEAADQRAAGVEGLTLKLSRADGVAQAGEARVAVDYRTFANAYGGEWASRLRVVRLSDGAVVPSANDRKAGTVTVTAPLAAAGVTGFVLAAAPEGEDGDFKATSLSPASTWNVSQQTGSFAWSYPIDAPEALGGPAPKLQLTYSSQAVDGRTSGTNSQGSWIGDGWDMWPGFIERSYRSCSDDRDEKEKADPNNKGLNAGDMCWFDDNATMSLNGGATELAKVASSYSGIDDTNVAYRGVSDDGSRIEQLKDKRDNGDVDGTYWRVTTTNGTQYFFGRSTGQGGSSAATKTESTWTVPVYGNHPGEPGHAKEFAKSRQDHAWRWNLDYAVDPNGNTITYYYGKEGGAYGREGDKDKRTTYDRSGYLKRVEYGSRSDAAATVRPAMRIMVDTADRCVGAPCFDANGKAVARRFPDTPWDQYCDKEPCKTQFSPTFWTQKRLSKITTQVYSGSGDAYEDVDSWAFNHTYLMAGTNEGKPMWLKSIQHTGEVTSAGGSKVTDPAVTFDPTADFMSNRVDGPSDGHSSLFRNRIAAITTESGAQLAVTYSKTDCTRGTLPKEHSNTKRCFPQYYGAEGETPKIDWFHKYVVDRVDLYDNTGGFEHEQTNYKYLDSPAWAYDDSELVKPKKRTWGQWRGYGKVEVRKGLESETQSRTEYRYFRGMDGDKQPKTDDERPPTGTPRNVDVEDSQGGKVADHPALAGMVREETVYNGNDWTSGKITTPGVQGPTATDGLLKAYQTHTASTRARLKLANGSTRWTKVATKVDSNNFTTELNDFGDEANTTDDRCSLTEYARNEDRWILGSVKRVESLGVNCDATVKRPQDVLADTRTYYDNADTYGAAPSRGNAVRVESLSGYSGSTPQYFTSSRTTYDALGRSTAESDALNRTSTTTYVPALTGPVTQTTEKNAAGHTSVTTFNKALNLAVKTVEDTAITEMTYDGSGRLLAAWGPGRPKASNLKAPTVSFAYELRNKAPTVVTSKALTGYGNGTYRTSIDLFDGLLRKRQTQSQSPAGGRTVTDTVYNSRGLVDWTSTPYYDIDNSPPDKTLVTPNYRPEIPSLTRNVYDGANRLTDAILVDRGDEKWRTTTKYAGDRRTIIPPEGETATTSVLDGRGRQAELRQYLDRAKAGSDDPATFNRTTYTFDPRDAVTGVVDPGNNRWTYEYDQRGMRTVEKDPDRGTTTFDYDLAGQRTSSKDNRGSQLFYEYDLLGRKTVMHKDTATGPKLAEWTYDTLTNGKGKLTSSTRFEYDAAGKAQSYTTAVAGYDISGQSTGLAVSVPPESGLCASGTLDPCKYTTSYKYRPSGDPDQVIYPAIGGLPAETLTSLYNTAGLASGLVGEIAGNNQIYAQEVVWNQLDKLIGQNLGEHGNRVALTYGYDEPTGRLQTFNAVPELKPDIYNLKYEYNPGGSITSISDTPDEGQPAETQCFSYDHLQRLTEAWTPASQSCSGAPNASTLGGPAAYWRSYGYDAAGNRKTEVTHGASDVTSTYNYPASGGAAATKPHAVTSVAGAVTQQYSYDEAGNTICRPTGDAANTCAADGTGNAESQRLSWDHEGRLTKSTDKAGDTSFIYDADGNRLIRKDPAGATLYLPNGTELRKPTAGTATATRYYSHASGIVAVRTAAGVSWIVSDHQATGSAVVSNDQKMTVARRRTLPFGEVRGVKPASWAGDKGFIGGTADNTGLTHLSAREYDPKIGRFVSVDPVIDLLDPQQWNGYGYAGNSPVTQSDPSGLLGSASCAPGEVGGWMACTGNENGGGIAPTTTGTTGGGNNGNGGNSSSPSNGTTPSGGDQRRDKCSGWDVVCKGKQKAKQYATWVDKSTDAAWEWTKEHKADIAGIGVGIVIGVGCTALTGGAGAIACGALGGAAQSLTKGLVNGDSAGDIAVNTVSGAIFGAATGGLSAGVSGGITAAVARQGLGGSLRAGGAALKSSLPVTRTALKDLAPKAVSRFVSGSKVSLAKDIREIGKAGLAKAIGKDLVKAAVSPAKGSVPAAMAGALPSDYSDVQKYSREGWSYSWWNVVPPLFTGGFD